MANWLVGLGQTYLTLLAAANALRGLGVMTESHNIVMMDAVAYALSTANDLDFLSVDFGAGNNVINLVPDTPVRYDGDFGNGARIEGTTSTVLLICHDLIIKDISIRNFGAGNGAYAISSRTITERCAIQAVTPYVTFQMSPAGGRTIPACIDTRIVGGQIPLIVESALSTCRGVTATNATGAAGIRVNANLSTPFTDNVCYNNANADYNGTGAPIAASNNASEDGTHFGTAGVLLTANPFEADGYTPLNNGQLDGAGTAITGTILDAAGLPFNNPRSIGAYEKILIPVIGRITGSIAGHGGLAGQGGIAGKHGGIAG